MFDELTIEFGDYRYDKLKPQNTPDFCWVARFKTKGITAYGKTMQMAIEKAVEMLKYKNFLDNR